jgi:phosphoribosylanthranilate isomerase
MKPKIKICGMKFPQNCLEIASLQPDFMGFIFYEKSPRNLETDLPSLPKSIKKVGVFVNETYDFIASKIEHYQLDYVQLHGEETPELCAKIENKFVKVIKAFSVDNNFNFNTLKEYKNSCSYFLFDTKAPLYGGNGFAFDWTILNNYTVDKPYFLSGGIGVESKNELQDFLKSTAAKNCFALDLNSKFEITSGLKNKPLLETFINNIRYENNL